MQLVYWTLAFMLFAAIGCLLIGEFTHAIGLGCVFYAMAWVFLKDHSKQE